MARKMATPKVEQYYVVSPRGKRLSIHETVESARRAIERTNNAVIYNEEARRLYAERRAAQGMNPF